MVLEAVTLFKVIVHVKGLGRIEGVHISDEVAIVLLTCIFGINKRLSYVLQQPDVALSPVDGRIHTGSCIVVDGILIGRNPLEGLGNFGGDEGRRVVGNILEIYSLYFIIIFVSFRLAQLLSCVYLLFLAFQFLCLGFELEWH